MDLLTKFSMANYKHCKNPCSPNAHLIPNDSPLLPDPTLYWSMIGTLQYLTFTRPNLSFTVQQASQFMSDPTSNHLPVVKRILRYLQGSIHQGLTFTLGPLTLSSYSDAIGLVILWIESSSLIFLCSLVILQLHGLLRSNPLSLVPPLRQNLEL